jgi:transcriptional regulator with XRE-family HTH domain
MNIKELRLLTGLSQREFGERLGLTSQSITKYESGSNVSNTVKKLIRYEFSRYLPEDEKLQIPALHKDEEPKDKSLIPIMANNEIIRVLRESINDLKADKEFLKSIINRDKI